MKNSKSPGNRILVRTCDGLELRDPPNYPNLGTQGHELEAGAITLIPAIKYTKTPGLLTNGVIASNT